jgi:hypothetical protein
LEKTLKAQETKVDKWDYIKLKGEGNHRIKKYLEEWGKIFAMHASDKVDIKNF